MAGKKDSFIVQITVDFDGVTTPESVMNWVWQALTLDRPRRMTFPAASAWRMFDPSDSSQQEVAP